MIRSARRRVYGHEYKTVYGIIPKRVCWRGRLECCSRSTVPPSLHYKDICGIFCCNVLRNSLTLETRRNIVPPPGQIQHLVVLMMENRSFDQLFGYLKSDAY